eukprot:Hpha_TRINITY_DN23031_c0_g1::TRINITY_DN23031_c0_g1_i1::g.109270::m.109270
MAIVIRTVEACTPPSNVSKKTLLYEGKGKGREEKSLFEEHREKDIWNRVGRSGGGHITLLYKRSWGDNGDDEVKEIARSSKPKAAQREPQRPVTPTRLQKEFMYPPSRKPLGKFHPPQCKECRAADRQAKRIDKDQTSRPLEAPGEHAVQHARHVLREVWIPNLTITRNQENAQKMITILKRQGKQREVEEYTEAAALLSRWATNKQEEKDAQAAKAPAVSPLTSPQAAGTDEPRRQRRNLGHLLLAPVVCPSPSGPSPRSALSPTRKSPQRQQGQVVVSAPSVGSSPKKGTARRQRDRGSSVVTPEPNSATTAATLSITPEQWEEMATIDFYGRAQYKQRQAEARRTGGREDRGE